MNEEVISMDRQKFFELLAQDLANEWTHLRFYLYHASAVTGLHRHEYKELFMKEAQSATR
jgi:ferritin-like protein